MAGVGTGGTITGVGEILKQRKPQIQVVAVEPKIHRFYPEENPAHIKSGNWSRLCSDVLNPEIIDEVITVTNEEAMDTSAFWRRQRAFSRHFFRSGCLCRITGSKGLKIKTKK